MRSVLRGAAIGLLSGAAFFFVPFLFRFLLFFLLTVFIIRLVWSRGRRGRFRQRYAIRDHDRYGNYPVPIDGGDRSPHFGSAPETRIPVL